MVIVPPPEATDPVIWRSPRPIAPRVGRRQSLEERLPRANEKRRASCSDVVFQPGGPAVLHTVIV